jgi:hypothetical protein
MSIVSAEPNALKLNSQRRRGTLNDRAAGRLHDDPATAVALVTARAIEKTAVRAHPLAFALGWVPGVRGKRYVGERPTT